MHILRIIVYFVELSNVIVLLSRSSRVMVQYRSNSDQHLVTSSCLMYVNAIVGGDYCTKFDFI